MVILENIDIDIDIDIDKAILQNIDIDKISNRFKLGISNRATLEASRWGHIRETRAAAHAANAEEENGEVRPVARNDVTRD